MTTLAWISAALAFVLALSLADQSGAQASTDAQGYAGGFLTENGGCIWLTDGGVSGLWVYQLKAGVTSQGGTVHRCGYFKVSQQNRNDDNPRTIHTSRYRCVDIGPGHTWGPTYQPDHLYGDGTTFCGFFTGFLPDERGCVTLHA